VLELDLRATLWTDDGTSTLLGQGARAEQQISA